MKRSIRSLALLGFGLCVVGRLLAAEASSILSWPDAVRIARDRNPDLRGAEQALESSRASRKESYNGVMPRLDLSNSYTRSKNDNSESNRWSARGTASMDIFNQARYANIQSSRSLWEQSQANLRFTATNLLFSLRQAFANLLYAQSFISVSESVMEIRKNNANLVSLRYDSGRESKGNSLRALAERTQAEADLNQAQRNLIAAQEEFKRQLGDDSPTQFQAQGSLDIGYSTAPLSDIDGYVESHPQVAVSEAEVVGAQASLKTARSVLWPNVTASYSRLLEGQSEFPDQPDWIAGGSLNLPIFGNGPTSAYYSSIAAKRSLDQAEENLRSIRYQIRSQLESSWSNFIGGVEQVNVQSKFLVAARQQNEEADIRYSSGLMSYDDWQRIVTDRVNFEQSMIRTERDAMIAEAQWNLARGKELGDTQ